MRGDHIGIVIKLDTKRRELFVDDPEYISSLRRTYYGSMNSGRLYLQPEEGLYLLDIRNAICVDAYDENKQYTFNDVAKHLYYPKLLSKYFILKDWRDRGLVLRPSNERFKPPKRIDRLTYPKESIDLPRLHVKGMFFPEDLITIIDDTEVGKRLYFEYWFGQFGTYKAEHRGKIHKLDVFETIFLMRHAGLKTDYSLTEIKRFAKERHELFPSMYKVYEDWRMKGYVLKTGFKFGSHFRIYFPGAKPGKRKEWIHSHHVLHVFPKTERRIISEWSRAIRVAHSVRKTFVLAIPGKQKDRKMDLDYLGYHRVKGGIAIPGENPPRYMLLALSEDEYIGGAELSYALNRCDELGLTLLLGIADRESSVTYYRVKRINLPESKYNYYEVEWIQP